MRDILDKSDKHIAETLEVAPASTSSYISVCKSKFNSIDENITELEQQIKEWEKTEHLESILNQLEGTDTDTVIDDLLETVQEELVNDEDITYLIAYADDQGRKQIQTVDVHPRDLSGKDILQYKRISSIEDVFN
ncbi:hypothetical protein [Haloquadratum walsbyi]|jgi:hypothetical protein|uniref:Uncharacterized protein n=1 Tax=Haloquadratum walsbyi J07HQW2 TaxID=1238425 RepID=U1NDW9_9EURY|nr:hypothetical protein [Haloquadratum walsbyi]ERG94933.1 MAG: hypothetical protein J07HQW2_01375 [Haloquadratum walsbyi J07HQW2]